MTIVIYQLSGLKEMISTDYLSVNLDFASNKVGREKKVQNIELETLR